jgi:hypothetical protein
MKKLFLLIALALLIFNILVDDAKKGHQRPWTEKDAISQQEGKQQGLQDFKELPDPILNHQEEKAKPVGREH